VARATFDAVVIALKDIVYMSQLSFDCRTVGHATFQLPFSLNTCANCAFILSLFVLISKQTSNSLEV